MTAAKYWGNPLTAIHPDSGLYPGCAGYFDNLSRESGKFLTYPASVPIPKTPTLWQIVKGAKVNMSSQSDRKGFMSNGDAIHEGATKVFLQSPPSQGIISANWFWQHESCTRKFQEVARVFFQSFPERGSEFVCGITNEEINFGLIGAGVTSIAEGRYQATVPVTLLGIAEILNALIIEPESLADLEAKSIAKQLENLLETAIAPLALDRIGVMAEIRSLLGGLLNRSDLPEVGANPENHNIRLPKDVLWRLGGGGDFEFFELPKESSPVTISSLVGLKPRSNLEWGVYKYAPVFMLRFILLHEWMHAVLRHFPRREIALRGNSPEFSNESWSHCCELAADRFAFESLMYSFPLFTSGKFQLKRVWAQVAFWSVNLLLMLIDQQEGPIGADTHPFAALRCRSLLDSFVDEAISNPFDEIRSQSATLAGKFVRAGWTRTFAHRLATFNDRVESVNADKRRYAKNLLSSFDELVRDAKDERSGPLKILVNFDGGNDEPEFVCLGWHDQKHPGGNFRLDVGREICWEVQTTDLRSRMYGIFGSEADSRLEELIDMGFLNRADLEKKQSNVGGERWRRGVIEDALTKWTRKKTKNAP